MVCSNLPNYFQIPSLPLSFPPPPPHHPTPLPLSLFPLRRRSAKYRIYKHFVSFQIERKMIVSITFLFFELNWFLFGSEIKETFCARSCSVQFEKKLNYSSPSVASLLLHHDKFYSWFFSNWKKYDRSYRFSCDF